MDGKTQRRSDLDLQMEALMDTMGGKPIVNVTTLGVGHAPFKRWSIIAVFVAVVLVLGLVAASRYDEQYSTQPDFKAVSLAAGSDVWGRRLQAASNLTNDPNAPSPPAVLAGKVQASSNLTNDPNVASPPAVVAGGKERLAIASTALTTWASMLNGAVKDPTIGLAVGASASILGGALAGDDLDPRDMLTLASNWVPAIAGLVNPGLGLGLTFAFSLISGILQSSEPDPIEEMYRRIMKEVEMKIDRAFLKRIIDEQRVNLQETIIQMSRLPDYQDTHDPESTYWEYRRLRNDLENIVAQLIKGVEMFHCGWDKQKYRASVLPLLITCFDTIFIASTEMIQAKPTIKEQVKGEINHRLSLSQPFLRDALRDAWTIRRHFIFQLQWVDHQPSHRDQCGKNTCYHRECFVKGTPHCTDGFLGVDVCEQKSCEVERHTYRVAGGAHCDRTSLGLCGVREHALLINAAKEVVRLQQDAVDAILNVNDDDYNFRDSVCNKMQFSRTEESFHNATRSLTGRVMKCYIRRAAAEIREDLKTLDKWRPDVLQQLSRKYLGKDLKLENLISDIGEVESSSGNAPVSALPDPGVSVRANTIYEAKGRILERNVPTENHCKQACADQEGCHCVEYYPNGGCVLVSKGAKQHEAPWYWLTKPKTIRLERVFESCDGRRIDRC